MQKKTAYSDLNRTVNGKNWSIIVTHSLTHAFLLAAHPGVLSVGNPKALQFSSSFFESYFVLQTSAQHFRGMFTNNKQIQIVFSILCKLGTNAGKETGLGNYNTSSCDGCQTSMDTNYRTFNIGETWRFKIAQIKITLEIS